MKKLFSISTVVAVCIAVVSCADLSDLNKRVDTLESRINSLEKVLSSLNDNIEALQALASAGSINSVEEKEGVYTLTLCNGEKITLSQGSVNTGNAPVMTVDNDGYWMVNYGGGAEHLLVDGQKVKATGADGVTPKFGVDAEGYWTISYNEGASFTRVLDHEGHPVKALPEGEIKDPFFSEVSYDNVTGKFSVRLTDGTVLSIPVVGDFLCEINASGVQEFNYKETKNFSVTMNGVATYFLYAPGGWEVSLSEGMLSVTAPEIPTKATLADTRTDINILAVSESGYSTIAKMRVMLSDSPIVVTPRASITAGNTTQTTISFTVNLSDADTWKYLIYPEGQQAPSAERVNEIGVTGVGVAATVEGLDINTKYVVYVVPMNGTILGEVASLSIKTKAKVISSYYEEWETGNVIIIAGQEYSKATHGDGVHVEVETEITANGVYFVEPGVNCTINNTGAFTKLIIVGNSPTQRANVDATAQIKFNQTSADDPSYFVCFNTDLVAAATITNYTFVQNTNAALGLVAFEQSSFTSLAGKPFTYISSNARSIKDFQFIDSEFIISANNVFFFSLSNSTATYETINFENSIIYAKAGSYTGFRLYQGPASTINKLTLKGCTIVNLFCDTSAYINCLNGKINESTIKDNLLYYSVSLPNNICLIRASDGNWPSAGEMKHNATFMPAGTQTVQVCFGGLKNAVVGAEEVTVLSEDPLSTFDQTTGRFIQKDGYVSYGAVR